MQESVNHWYAVVIYPTRNLESNDQQPYRLQLDSPQVQRIYLDELGTAAPHSLQLAVLQLIVENEETAVDRGKELILLAREQLVDEATRKKIVELIETILLYKFTQLSREELVAMLGIDDDFKKTRMYQSMKQEVKQEVVPRFLALGLSVEQVAQALDLTVEQVQQAAPHQSS